MTFPVNPDIGTIPRAVLAAFLPPDVGVRRGKNGKLYLATPAGAWYCNTPGAQAYLAENMQPLAGETPAPAPVETPAPEPEPPHLVESVTPEPVAAPTEAANDESHKPAGLLASFFGSLD